jgi:hypothetical protein
MRPIKGSGQGKRARRWIFELETAVGWHRMVMRYTLLNENGHGWVV